MGETHISGVRIDVRSISRHIWFGVSSPTQTGPSCKRIVGIVQQRHETIVSGEICSDLVYYVSMRVEIRGLRLFAILSVIQVFFFFFFSINSFLLLFINEKGNRHCVQCSSFKHQCIYLNTEIYVNGNANRKIYTYSLYLSM